MTVSVMVTARRKLFLTFLQRHSNSRCSSPPAAAVARWTGTAGMSPARETINLRNHPNNIGSVRCVARNAKDNLGSVTRRAMDTPSFQSPSLSISQVARSQPVEADSQVRSKLAGGSYPGLGLIPDEFPPESALQQTLQESKHTPACDDGILSTCKSAMFGIVDPVPDFDDAAAYASRSVLELLRAYLVLRACAIRPLVENSESLLSVGYRTIGKTLINRILKITVFAHFCGGETAQEVGRRAEGLQSLGIGAILDYAAEVDLRPAAEKEAKDLGKGTKREKQFVLEKQAKGRTYDDEGEAACDARMLRFLTCIRAVRDQTPGGFAAVKLSALGDSHLLNRLTTLVQVIRRFEDFDHGCDGTISHEEFEAGCRWWFSSGSSEDHATLLRVMKQLDPENTGTINCVEWKKWMHSDNLGEITKNIRRRGPHTATALDEDEIALKNAMYGRIQTLANAASESEVRLVIDAEQSWLQPAIDDTVYHLQREFNKAAPTIYTTYQCYLKDSLVRISADLERAQQGGYAWAGKLVRGAYMVSERERAKEESRDCPVFETAEETHACYNAAINMVLKHMAKGSRAEVMIATHNQVSVEHTIKSMQQLGIRRDSGVSFGQLLGMADNITVPLGAQGYKAYKYLPYGKVDETIPYLLRRAQENVTMLGGASHERGLLLKAMCRRACSPLPRLSMPRCR